jgi:hypothetical protein
VTIPVKATGRSISSGLRVPSFGLTFRHVLADREDAVEVAHAVLLEQVANLRMARLAATLEHQLAVLKTYVMTRFRAGRQGQGV